MEKDRKKILYSAALLLLSVLVAATTVFAWFTEDDALVGSNRDFTVYIGDIDLEVNCYAGVDMDKNGVLDKYITDGMGNYVQAEDWTDSNGTLHEKSSRADILQYLYQPMTRKFENDGEYNTYEDIVSGTGILMKVVVKNPLDNLCSARMDMYFSDMDDYIFKSLSSSNYFTDAIIGENSARIMFEITDMSVSVYENELTEIDGENYSDLAVLDAENNTYKSWELYDSSDETISRYFWDLSNNERVFSGALFNSEDYDIDEVMTIAPGQLMEIDFNVSCMYPSVIDEYYSSYWEHFLTENAAAYTSSEITELRKRYGEELLYLVATDDDVFNKQLDFCIEKIYVAGKQLPRSSEEYTVYYVATVNGERVVVPSVGQLYGDRITFPTAAQALTLGSPSGYYFNSAMTNSVSESDIVVGNMIIYCN